MINTTLDILYLTLAGCAVLITFFICWAFYYFVRMERNAVYTMEKFTNVLRKADEVLEVAKDKLHSSGTYIAIAANAAKNVVEYLQETKAKKKSKR